MKGQKQAVVEYVKAALGSAFVPHKDNALSMLNSTQLEQIKASVGSDIINGIVEYGKDKTNTSEVRSYARSMVMNHLKKAKELNGGSKNDSRKNEGAGINVNEAKPNTASPKTHKYKGVNLEFFDPELQDFVKTL